MEPGKYKAIVKNYGVVTSPNGTAQVKVVFSFDGGIEYSWYGGLASEKQQAITTKNLITLGASASNIDKVELGLKGGVLNTNKEFEIVVKNNTWNGKTTPRIEYINDPTEVKQGSNYLQNTGVLGTLKGLALSLEGENPQAQNKGSDTITF